MTQTTLDYLKEIQATAQAMKKAADDGQLNELVRLVGLLDFVATNAMKAYRAEHK